MRESDVLVVGAGPVGLAVACALLAHGVSVRVVDKASGPAVTSRANFVHARGSEVLDRLRALGNLPNESVRAMQITTILGGRPIMKLRFGDSGMKTAAPPMVISQAKVEATLRDRLAELGGKVEWATPLVDVRQDVSGATATLGDGEQARVGWVVGCDGAGSATRRLAGIGFPGVKLSERFLLADVRLDWDLDRSGTTGWIHSAGMLGAMPMPDPTGSNDLWRILAYDPGQLGDKPTEEEILRRLEQILPERTASPSLRIRGAVWLSMFSVHRRLADTYRRGRVLLAGDAAHTHAPFGGQGMLTGLGDAENLAWKLSLVVHGLGGEALLNTYEAERRPLATDVLRGTSAVTKVNIARGPVGRFLRDRVIAPTFNLRWIQRWSTFTTSQLWVSYRRGPLGGRSFAKPRPGDRVADTTIGGSRLYAELCGRWALILPADGDDPALEETARKYLGEHVVVHRRDDASEQDAFLVRPDGHLAWRGRGRPDRLDRWLQNALR